MPCHCGSFSTLLCRYPLNVALLRLASTPCTVKKYLAALNALLFYTSINPVRVLHLFLSSKQRGEGAVYLLLTDHAVDLWYGCLFINFVLYSIFYSLFSGLHDTAGQSAFLYAAPHVKLSAKAILRNRFHLCYNIHGSKNK